ncbi:mitochondrial genome maintenance protein Mgm101p [[Candida] jaroonii]|uniref:Mitochondrial genome maintenance protein Mgm101p n=1 Tax=[Candida] jaroonii TaxID=467808 RepID=A0ACA9Y0U8_9ASCO|nr:mitochondrial genome maintenance protein Mgm101p [[Candida] jaroonii]
MFKALRIPFRSYALFKDLPRRTASATTPPRPVKPIISSNGPKISKPVEEEDIEEPVVQPVGHLSFHDSPIGINPSHGNGPINWSDSFHGLGQAPFPKEIIDTLLAPIENDDIEITPDGLLYLPEIKYRRMLNRAFGPGGWGLAPRTETFITPRQISREYALICHGRLVSVARGEQDYFGGEEKITTALEGCKSNALMRCCKDLGIASELWDPSFIKPWKKKYCDEVFAEHVVNKKKKKLWKLKRNKSLDYPYKQV